jgi:hypothetical protein
LLNAKAIKYIAGAAGVLRLFRMFNSTASNKDTEEVIKDEEANTGLALSYPLSNYNVWADELQAAMFDTGTDEDTIFSIFERLKNIRDLLQLIKSFGVRTYYVFGISQGDYNLAQWFQEELSTSDIEEINSILHAKNITYSL